MVCIVFYVKHLIYLKVFNVHIECFKCVLELMEERKKVWDESVKMHKLNLGDSSAFLNFDETDPFNESNIKQKEKEYLLRG